MIFPQSDTWQWKFWNFSEFSLILHMKHYLPKIFRVAKAPNSDCNMCCRFLNWQKFLHEEFRSLSKSQNHFFRKTEFFGWKLKMECFELKVSVIKVFSNFGFCWKFLKFLGIYISWNFLEFSWYTYSVEICDEHCTLNRSSFGLSHVMWPTFIIAFDVCTLNAKFVSHMHTLIKSDGY